MKNNTNYNKIVLPSHRTLYLFSKLSSSPSTKSLMYNMLDVLFDGDVKPAYSVLKGYYYFYSFYNNNKY